VERERGRRKKLTTETTKKQNNRLSPSPLVTFLILFFPPISPQQFCRQFQIQNTTKEGRKEGRKEGEEERGMRTLL
jgi:hypothetical protein